MKAKSIKGSSPEEIQSALQQSMSDRFKPTLAIVFISIKQDRKAVCEILSNEAIDVVGATSSGEFTDSEQSQGEIAIMLIELNRNNYCIQFEDIGERSLSEAATHLAEGAKQKFNKPALILCSTLLSTSGKMI